MATILHMTGEPDDKALARAMAAGDKAAEDLFAQKFRKRLVEHAKWKGIPTDDCEDIADETIITAIGQLRRGVFRGDSSITTWLDKILHGKAIDFWRKRSKEGLPATLDERSEAQSGQPGSGLVHIHSDPVERLIVQEVLDRMPAKHRRILLLNQRDGYTTEEMASLLGWRAGTVGRVLAEAKAMFREFVLRSEEFGGETRQGD